MIEVRLENDERYGESVVVVAIPEEGTLRPFALPLEEGYQEHVWSPGELHGLPEVVVDKGGPSMEPPGHFFVHCVWVKERNEWVGIVRVEGYFDSITHLDAIWDVNSPFELDEAYGRWILEAYGIAAGTLPPREALRTAPVQLRALSRRTENS